MDRDERLKNLKEDRQALLEGLPKSIPAPELPDAFLEAMVENASAYARVPLRFLEGCGFPVRPPSDFAPGPEGDEEVRAELWRLVLGSALIGFFFQFTDHLDDRAFYTYLFEEALRDATAFDPGSDPPAALVHDLLMEAPVEMTRLRLKYYRDRFEDQVEDDIVYLEEMGEPVPDPEPPPADRDRYLP